MRLEPITSCVKPGKGAPSSIPAKTSLNFGITNTFNIRGMMIAAGETDQRQDQNVFQRSANLRNSVAYDSPAGRQNLAHIRRCVRPPSAWPWPCGGSNRLERAPGRALRCIPFCNAPPPNENARRPICRCWRRPFDDGIFRRLPLLQPQFQQVQKQPRAFFRRMGMVRRNKGRRSGSLQTRARRAAMPPPAGAKERNGGSELKKSEDYMRLVLPHIAAERVHHPNQQSEYRRDCQITSWPSNRNRDR